MASAATLPRDAPVRALEHEELAWIAGVPLAFAMVGLAVLLGRPLGRALLGPGSGAGHFWPSVIRRPEPEEEGRYAIELLVAPAIAAVAYAAARLPLRLPARTIDALRVAAQAALLCLLLGGLLAQQHVLWPAYEHIINAYRIFTPATLAAAALLSLALLALLRGRAALDRIASWARERDAVRVACLLAAALLTAIWLLTAIHVDAEIGRAQSSHLIPWDTNEAYAVLDGRTPLVDFHAQYAQLWPYVAAAAMALAGSSLGVLTTIMASASLLVLLGIYATFRRILRSSLLALAVYLPFMATSFFIVWGTFENRFSPAGILSLFPLRYGGAYLLAWLTARHVDRVAPRRAAVLLFAGGLVALNNLEFGVPALVATVVALGCVDRPRSWRAVARLLVTAAAGLLAAGLAICAVTLVRAGALPRFSLLLEFPRLYGPGGWVLGPMPRIGLYIAVYATLVAAVVVALMRALADERDRVLTAMLAWSGVFGLLAALYFVGTSEYLNLISLFSAWAFALALLTIAVVRRLAGARRRPTLAELAVLFGFGVAVCSLVQMPLPWAQLSRLRSHGPLALYDRPAVRRFVVRATAGEHKVALLLPLGHRIAYELGRTNVSPYSGAESIPTAQQARTAIEALRREGVDRALIGLGDPTAGNVLPDVVGAFVRGGYTVRAQVEGVVEVSAGP
jgi:hypothetical protein